MREEGGRPVEVRVLGPVELAGPEGAVPVRAEKQQRLLAALAIDAGRSRTVDALIEAVWGERAPASARKLLQVYVSQLRKQLPEPARIATRGAGYALEVPDGSIDSARFERLLGEGSDALRAGNPPLAVSRLTRALALWRGEPFGTLAYEQFAREEAERLAELRVLCEEERFAAELALGRHADVLADLRAFAAKQPLRERARELTMLALYRCGRQAEALATYAETREHLRDELGLEPGPELGELQRRILRQDPALAAPLISGPHFIVPSAPNRLIGRTRELAEIQDLLRRDDVRLLVLSGAGGTGKTRLALDAARNATGGFANGAAFVPLASVHDPTLVAGTIARALDTRETPKARPVEALMDLIRDRELLLVLDNAEHLREATPLFVELLAQAPGLTLLVTSRVVLHLSGEHVYPVEPLTERDAAVLFDERADQAGRRTRRPEDDDVVAEIARRLDGLPLALELAAGRTRSLTLAQLLARLEQRLPLLIGGPRDLPARQQTLHATIDWSNDLLAPSEQQLLAQLSTFAGGCTLEAAVAVTGAELDGLQALVENNLVRHDDGRYSMLETIREYADARLGELDPKRETALRHAEHFLELAEQLEEELDGEHETHWLTLLEVELPNLRAALTFLGRSGRGDLALRLSGALRTFWLKRGHLTEGRAWFATTLSGDAARNVAREKALFGAALLATLQADWPEGIRLARACSELCAEIGDGTFMAIALVVLGRATLGAGDEREAAILYEQAIERAQATGDSRSHAMARMNRGYLALSDGDHGRAEAELQVARAEFAALDDGYGVARSLAALGSVAIQGDRKDDAIAFLRQSLEHGRATQDGESLAWPLQLLGVAETETEPEHAATLLGAAEALRESLGISLQGIELAQHAQALAKLRASLDAETLRAAWATGRARPLVEPWLYRR